VRCTSMSSRDPPRDREPAALDVPGTSAVEDAFFVVGIGASAGGLEAVSALLRRTTVDGAAFVVVQHLAPTQTSMLTELLGRASPLRVVTVTDGAAVEPNCVYVTPPNAQLAVEGGVLRVITPQLGTRPEMPIDSFFRSLADDRGTSAMGVVMSGTGTDGTLGLAAIKGAGGVTFVQDPTTAKFDGMPRSALDSGAADFCLAPEAIADEILHLSTHTHVRRSVPLAQSHDHLVQLGELLKTAFGIDLTHYKPTTIERRIQRRMAAHRIARIEDYVRLCRTDRKELDALHKDLLINVTNFFRDIEPFEVLAAEIVPRILEAKRDSDVLRIWVPGCSSGEEAYSIAICVLEALEAKARNLKLQIFATDLDLDAVNQARRAVYPTTIAADVGPERLQRFFIKTDDDGYQVARRVRDLVVFSVQNISRDPPFSKLDLISCRNLLMYLQPAVQKRVLRILHYALNPKGFLLLGHSESIGDASDLFALIDRKNKFYATKHVVVADSPLELGSNGPSTTPPPRYQAQPIVAVRPVVSIAHLADRKILEQYAPPAVVINESLDVLYYRGRSDRYLQHPIGVATHNVLKLARPELHPVLKAAVGKVFATNEPVVTLSQVRSDDGELHPFTLIAQPLLEPETRARCILVVFKDHDSDQLAAPAGARSPEAPERSNDSTHELRQELALTKEYLQSTVEELERTNEDLKSANEELQSSNEELQSTNEELETSKEELQSTNEELVTLNDELQDRMRELGGANDDLHNLLLGVDRVVVIVGLDLRIRRFTQAAERLLNLLPADIGRSAALLNSFLGGFGIENVVADSIKQLAPVERDMSATDGRWYSLRVVPYRTLDLAIRGAVISIVDIDLTKRRADLSAAVNDYAADGLAAVQHPLMIVDATRSVVWVNEPYYEMFQLTPQEILGARLPRIGTGAWGGRDLDKRIDDTLRAGTPFRDHRLTVKLEEDAESHVLISGSRVRLTGDEAKLVLLSIEPDLDRGPEEHHGR
jgi:two-component system, chemotaxis family, CheB/CheR fusion protein